MSDLPADYRERLDLRTIIAEIDRKRAETLKLQEEREKFIAEARKMNRDRWLAPWVLLVSLLSVNRQRCRGCRDQPSLALNRARPLSRMSRHGNARRRSLLALPGHWRSAPTGQDPADAALPETSDAHVLKRLPLPGRSRDLPARPGPASRLIRREPMGALVILAILLCWALPWLMFPILFIAAAIAAVVAAVVIARDLWKWYQACDARTHLAITISAAIFFAPLVIGAIVEVARAVVG